MKRLIPLLLFGMIGIATVPSPVVAQQTGTVTYQFSGGGAIAVTVNYRTRQITYHYPDGSQFTENPQDFEALARWMGNHLIRQ